MQQHSGNSSHSIIKPSPEFPPCCGTGCAVCVLDMVEDYAPLATVESQAALPACCNTGCLICVQDYPELYRNGQPDQTNDPTQMIALLEAMEAAETMAAQN